MSLPQYPKYKNSGVAWLGDVPEHWEIKRLKHCLSLITEKAETCNNKVALENIESWSGKYQITNSEFEGDGIAFEVGDILFGKLRPYLAKAYLAEFSGEAVGDFHVMRPNKNVAPRFAQYQIINRDFIALVDGSTFGSKMPRASWDFVGNMPFPLPAISEQTTIAAFLDRETAKIDALIAEQEKLITLLAEKRQATISHAVTKGLNPNAPMKNSGVAWLGDVPEHWEIISLKHIISNIESGVSVNAIDMPATEEEIAVLKTSCVYRGIFDASENKVVVPEDLIRVSCPVQAGALIVSRMNTPDLVGAAGLVTENFVNLFLPDRLWQIHFHAAKPSYIHFWTRSRFYRAQVETACAGTSSSMQNLSQEDFRNFVLPLPTLKEQTTIAAFLDRETAKIDALTAEAKRGIGLLKERRAALISAAVTGKINVCNFV